MAMNSFKKMIMMANQIDDKPSLPSHLVRCEYLEATGTQYIDLGYTLGYENKVVVDVYSTKQTSNNVVCGINKPDDRRFMLNISASYVPTAFSNAYSIAPKYKDERQLYIMDFTGIYVNDVFYIWDKTPADFTTEGNVYLCATNTSSGAANLFYKGKIYSCQIYENDVPIHDYIPALRIADSKPGMYDLVSGQFFTNQGTGEFTYG